MLAATHIYIYLLGSLKGDDWEGGIPPQEAVLSNATAATIVRHRSDMELVLCVQDKKQKHRLMVLKRHAVSGLEGSRVPRACSSPVLRLQPQLLLKRQAELKEIAA